MDASATNTFLGATRFRTNPRLGGRVVRTSDSRLEVEGSPPDHDTAWLFISETGDRLRRVNVLDIVTTT